MSMLCSRVARAAARVACSGRAAMTTAASSAAAAVARPEDPRTIAYPVNMHRSNAQELVSRVPVIEVDAHVAMCDGGGALTRSWMRRGLLQSRP